MNQTGTAALSGNCDEHVTSAVQFDRTSNVAVQEQTDMYHASNEMVKWSGEI